MKKWHNLLIITFIVVGIIIVASASSLNANTREYIYPSIIITSNGQTQDSIIEDFNVNDPKHQLATSVRKGENNSIILEMTDEQVEDWIDKVEKSISECKEAAKKENCEIIVNNEYTEFIYKLSKNANAAQYSINSTLIETQCLEHQIFTGIKYNDLKLNTIVINIETGKVMVDADLGEEFAINPEDWDE